MRTPGTGLTLAEQVDAEGRRLAAMHPAGEGRWTAAALAVAFALHAAALFIPVRSAPGPPPALPERPEGIVIARWIPPPAAGDRRSVPSPPTPERSAGEAARDPLVRRGPLPAWILEPVPEPPPSPRLETLPPEAASLPVPPPAADEPPRAPVEVVRPLPIPETKVEPEYPAVARALRARGSVVVEVIVGTDGAVKGARVLECSRPGVGFEEAALAAVRRWSFHPGRLGDEPVESSTVVRVEFR